MLTLYPHDSQSVEEEAASKYGVRPVPFRMDSKYQSGVVNAYFNLVIAYGDQFEVLGFDDLIDIKMKNDSDVDVILKNPEYAITRAIRKTLATFQSSGNPFDLIPGGVKFLGYVTPTSNMPAGMREVRSALDEALAELKDQAGDKLTVHFVDPDAGNGELADELQAKYGFAPQIASLLDTRQFWFYLMLEYGDNAVQIPLPDELTKEAIKRAVAASLQRLAPGFMKTVALVKPESPAMEPWQQQYMPPSGKHFAQLEAFLGENVRIKDTDLKSGHVPSDADLLMVLAPSALDKKQLFAIDQFLMQGGSVIMTTAPFDVTVTQTISASRHASGLSEWLAHHGLTLQNTLVLDPDNASLPLPVPRQIGPITVNEIQMLPYPYFPDIGSRGLNQRNPITSGLDQLSMNWAVPLDINATKNSARTVSILARSSQKSWTSETTHLIPDYQLYPDTGFRPSDDRQAYPLAVAVEGKFDSFFTNKTLPQITSDEESNATQPDIAGVIKHSSDSAKLIIVSSNAFAEDISLQLASQGLGTIYTQPLEFMQNAIDWSLEDRGLLLIRSRASFARTLRPMQSDEQMAIEIINYVAALFGLGIIWLWRRRARKIAVKHFESVLKEVKS